MRVRLIHWNDDEAGVRVEQLQGVGYRVEYDVPDPSILKSFRSDPPDVIVIDLERRPATGRDVGVALRSSPKTRGIPLVFVGGIPEKVGLVRRVLPDAAFGAWDDVERLIRGAIDNAPESPVAPAHALVGYSGTPLPQKLGIKPGSTVALVGAPKDFEIPADSLPDGVTVRRSNRGRRQLTLWFVMSRTQLERGIDQMIRHAAGGSLWIVWTKRASGVESDLTQNMVRQTGLACGLVDFKICAIDDTWSGLRFSQRDDK